MTRTTAVVVVCLAGLVAAGCGGSSGGGAGAPVTGTRLNTYWQDDGTALVRVAHDLDAVDVSALVQEGAGWREAAGTFTPDGRFAIPDVGNSPYVLRVVTPSAAPRYFPESGRVIDLGSELVGRPERQFATLSSPITFSLSGLEPWAPGDSITVFSTGAAYSWIGLLPSATAGATSGDLLIDFKNRPLPVTGDLGWFVQMAQRTDAASGTTYTAATRSAQLTMLADMHDGDTANLGIPLGVGAATGSVGMDLRRSQLAASVAAMAPAATATLSSLSVSVRAYPRSLSASYVTLLSVPTSSATTDLNLGTLTYARPFPSWFNEVRTIDMTIAVQIPGALGAAGLTQLLTMSRVEPLPGASSPVVPTLGTAQAPLVGGRDALQPQPAVGTTPIIAWSAPALGTATRYVVTIYEMGAGAVSARASVVTTGTSIAVPPLVMAPGGVYYAIIYAYAEPGFDVAAPLRITAPREYVPLVTAPFAP